MPINPGDQVVVVPKAEFEAIVGCLQFEGQRHAVRVSSNSLVATVTQERHGLIVLDTQEIQ